MTNRWDIPTTERPFKHWTGGESWEVDGSVTTYETEESSEADPDDIEEQIYTPSMACLEVKVGDKVVLNITGDRDQWGTWWKLILTQYDGTTAGVILAQEDGRPSFIKALGDGIRAIAGWELTPGEPWPWPEEKQDG